MEMKTAPLDRARRSLEGLSVGDALGQSFFRNRGESDHAVLRGRRLPPAPWRWSDDTVMAAAIVDVLERRGFVDQDELAAEFSRRFQEEPERGYGAMAYWLLFQLGEGRPWREVSGEVFNGQGSLGNGAAMRVAPLGAFFADDLDRAVEEARASAVITHSHQDGQAGAVAVAIAAAILCRRSELGKSVAATEFLGLVLERTPESETRSGIERAVELLGAPVQEAAGALGDGSLVRSSDTVPFSLWCAARHPDDFEAALMLALSGVVAPDADRDTVLAIVGGVVGANAEPPREWVSCREPLPARRLSGSGTSSSVV